MKKRFGLAGIRTQTLKHVILGQRHQLVLYKVFRDYKVSLYKMKSKFTEESDSAESIL